MFMIEYATARSVSLYGEADADWARCPVRFVDREMADWEASMRALDDSSYTYRVVELDAEEVAA